MCLAPKAQENSLKFKQINYVRESNGHLSVLKSKWNQKGGGWRNLESKHKNKDSSKIICDRSFLPVPVFI